MHTRAMHACMHTYADLEMHNVTESSTWMMGHGFINVKLFNHRKEGGYEVRYFRKGVFPNDRALFVSTDSNLGQMVMCPRRHCKGEDVYFLVSSSAVPAHFPVGTKKSQNSAVYKSQQYRGLAQ